jgi:hypothetical protein
MAAIALLDAVTSTGDGPAKLLANLTRHHTLQVVVTGDPTVVVVTLKGSLDGTTFFVLETVTFDAGEITAEAAIRFSVDKAVTHVRANLVTLTAGTTPTVTALYEGDNFAAKNIGRRGQF